MESKNLLSAQVHIVCVCINIISIRSTSLDPSDSRRVLCISLGSREDKNGEKHQGKKRDSNNDQMSLWSILSK